MHRPALYRGSAGVVGPPSDARLGESGGRLDSQHGAVVEFAEGAGIGIGIGGIVVLPQDLPNTGTRDFARASPIRNKCSPRGTVPAIQGLPEDRHCFFGDVDLTVFPAVTEACGHCQYFGAGRVTGL